jgi:hypothetical protein
LVERQRYYTKNDTIKNFKVKDVYFDLDTSFKIADNSINHKSKPLPGSFQGAEKLHGTLNLLHISELNRSIDKSADNFTLNF